MASGHTCGYDEQQFWWEVDKQTDRLTVFLGCERWPVELQRTNILNNISPVSVPQDLSENSTSSIDSPLTPQTGHRRPHRLKEVFGKLIEVLNGFREASERLIDASNRLLESWFHRSLAPQGPLPHQRQTTQLLQSLFWQRVLLTIYYMSVNRLLVPIGLH